MCICAYKSIYLPNYFVGNLNLIEKVNLLIVTEVNWMGAALSLNAFV